MTSHHRRISLLAFRCKGHARDTNPPQHTANIHNHVAFSMKVERVYFKNRPIKLSSNKINFKQN